MAEGQQKRKRESSYDTTLRIRATRRRTLEEYAYNLEGLLPYEADHVAIDCDRIRFFDGRPEYSLDPDGRCRWHGDEVGSWRYGSFSNLREYFSILPYVDGDTFMYSRTLTKI